MWNIVSHLVTLGELFLDEPLIIGDVIEVFYVPTNATIGGIEQITTLISWSIVVNPLIIPVSSLIEVT
jgi:hypothetical protein